MSGTVLPPSPNLARRIFDQRRDGLHHHRAQAVGEALPRRGVAGEIDDFLDTDYFARYLTAAGEAVDEA